MPSWAAVSHWVYKILIGPRWRGKGNELERPVIWKGLSLLEGSPGHAGRREGGWWVKHSALGLAAATDTLCRHVFTGPAGISADTRQMKTPPLLPEAVSTPEVWQAG